MIIETSQPAMEPYVAVAASGLPLYARTAVCREALVVKVPEGVAPISAGINHGAKAMPSPVLVARLTVNRTRIRRRR